MRWLSQLFSRNRRYDDLSASIREHIKERTEELIEDGMPPVQAGQTARREFGNVALSPTMRMTDWLDSTWRNVRATMVSITAPRSSSKR